MKAEQVQVTLLPSRVVSPTDPGHMSISFHGPSIEPVHRGFRFRIGDLPKPFRSPHRFRDFLFEDRVPGYVFDEFEFHIKCQMYLADCLMRAWPVKSESAVDEICASVPRREGWYSFNPDDFEDCHNCVTWAVSQINRVVSEVVLTRPRQGRIKEMVTILSNALLRNEP